MEIGRKNRNDRRYSLSLVENKILKNPYTQEMLRNRMLLGEGRHPKDRFEIWTTDASHNITDLWLNEDKTLLMGRADILDTPVGRIIQTLIDYGSHLGVSARASGRVDYSEDGYEVDEETYDFRTFDFVTNPGFESSRVVGVNESVEDSVNAFYTSIKSLLDGETDTATLLAIKSILESVEDDTLKGLLPVLEEKLTESSTETTKLKVLEDEATELRSKVLASDAEISDLRDQAQEDGKKIEELVNQNSALTSQLNLYKSLISDDAETEVSFLRDRVFELESALDESSARVVELESALDESSARVAELEDEREELIAMVSSLVDIIDSLSEDKKTLQSDLETAQSSLDSITEEREMGQKPRKVEQVSKKEVKKASRVPVLESLTSGAPVSAKSSNGEVDKRLLSLCERVRNK